MSKKDKNPHKPEKNYYAYFIVIIFVLGFIIYSNILHSPLELDDASLLEKSQLIHNNSVFIKFNQPRYIGLITFALNYRIHKLDVFGYHLINIIIHIMNAVVVFLIAKKIFAIAGQDSRKNISFYAPFITALIFLVHPVQTQAVTYISQRFTSLAALFAMISILLYLEFRTREPREYSLLIFSIVCALAAYKTKENTAALLLIIIAIELIFFRRSSVPVKQKLLYLVPYFLLLGVIAISFTGVQHQFDKIREQVEIKSKQTESISRLQYLMTEFRVVVTYMRLLVLPVHQSIDYYFELSQSMFEMSTLLSFCVILLFLLIAILSASEFPVSSFGILWFFIFLIVESSVIPIADVIFEHRIYLPSVGLIIALIYFLYRIIPQRAWKILTIALGAVIVTLSIAAYARNEVWKDRVELWGDAVKKFPENPRAHLNLGISLAEKGRDEEAIKELETGLLNDKSSAMARSDLALLYFKKGIIPQGIKWMNAAVTLNPAFITEYSKSALNFLDQQDFNNALVVLNNAYHLNSSDFMINFLFGRAYCSMKNLELALHFYDRAININSTYPEAYHDKALCLFLAGKLNKSRDAFFQCIKLKPDYYDSYYFIAVTYEGEQDLANAAAYFKQAIAIAPPGSKVSMKSQERLRGIGK